MPQHRPKPKLKRVLRLDSIPIDSTYWTKEGYFIDCPIVTTTGIFEYLEEDGSIRRELRLPENVFDKESLASYKAMPVIITHDAGEVDAENVQEECIGTILSEGIEDGDSVRCEIVIHNTLEMQNCNLKELSLGYDLEWDETPGIWNGEPYDVIQTNIRVNHLALVGEARAGHTARLNIDGRDKTLKGAKVKMKKNSTTKKRGKHDSSESAVDEYKTRRDNRLAEGSDNEDEGLHDQEQDNGGGFNEHTSGVRDRRDTRDQGGDPTTVDEAMEQIAQQDEDIEELLGIVEALSAAPLAQDENEDTENEDENEDTDNEDENEDNSESEDNSINADGIDAMISERLMLARLGDRINLDGLENLSAMDAKKKIIRHLSPSMRLDGKSKSYINGVFDVAVASIPERKDTNFQRNQMSNRHDSSGLGKAPSSSARSSREKMIAKQNKGGK